jgi:hypothetical protein
VTISSDLRWHLHVNNICLKASRSLNFIRRNIYRCSPDIKSLAYFSLVRPHLEYAAAAWDPYTLQDTSQLEKVQRRAARFVRNNYKFTTSVSHLLSELSWDQLSERRRITRLTMMYKAVHGLAALPIDHLSHSTRTTRSASVHTFINIPCRVDSFKFSFFPRTVSDWNKLSEVTHLKPSVEAFRQALFNPAVSPCC